MDALIEALSLSPGMALGGIILVAAIWLTNKINKISWQIRALDEKFDTDFAEMKEDMAAFKASNSAEHAKLHAKVETVAQRTSRIEGKLDIGRTDHDG